VQLRAVNHSGEEQMNVLDRVQKKATEFANLTKDSNCEMAQRRKIARVFALYKAYSCLEDHI
jgi:hypothetical protein